MNNYCVYDLQFPNGKHYIGISKNPEKRWRNGKGYETQGKIANAISSFGWENITHKIVVDDITKEQAEKLEMYLIDELNTIEDGYNTSIGGNNINSSYLNEHILYMIRESKFLDKKYGIEQSEDDIISIFEKGHTDSELSKIYNLIDEYVEQNLSDYKQLHSNIFYDGRQERCEGYWYYIRMIWNTIVENIPVNKPKIKSYVQYRAENIMNKLQNT